MLPIIVEEDVRRILEVKCGHSDFIVNDFKLDEVNTLRFHSDNNILIVNATVRGRQDRYVFFFKTINTTSEVFERYLGPSRIFEKEHAVLTEVIPELQKTACKKITAECYLSKLFNFIALEDLSQLGFRPCGKPLDLKHAKLALSAFANFHAASIAYEEKLGIKLGEKFEHTLYETLLLVRSDLKEPLMMSLDTQLRAFGRSYLTHIHPAVRDRIFTRILYDSFSLQRPSNKFRNVLNQGDAWGNNILYKYEGAEPVDAILVDFQVVRQAPPAQELAMFFYVACPGTEFLQNHMTDLNEFYYKELDRFLTEQELDTSRVFPKEDFLASCEEYRRFGLCNRVYYTMVTELPLELLARAAQNPKIFCDLMVGGGTDLLFEAYENYPEFKRSMDEAIDDAIDFYKDL